MNNFKSILREDRSGSQFYCLISNLLYSMTHNKRLYIDRKEESLLLQPLFDKVEVLTDQIDAQDLDISLRGSSYKLVREIKLDLITYAKQKLNLNAKKPLNIDFKTKQIAIHVRNGDVSKEPIHDGFRVHEYCKNLIEQDDIVYNRREMDKHGPDRQCQTSEAALDKILSEVCSKHPEKEVHLISENQGVSEKKYKNISEKYNIRFFSSDIDTDLYHLATSDILIGARSNFSIMALYYFTGKDFFYPHWSLYTCLGLGTKYDQTNYESFRNL